MVQGVICLQAKEIVRARPFTDPDHIANDRNTLRYMLTQLCLLLEYPYRIPRTVLFTRSEDDEWFHRLVLPRPEQLRVQKPVTVVGFFGQRREKANLELAHEFDRILIAEIDDHPGLLSYSTMALAGGNYGNLVLFANRNARNHWSTSQAHAQAVNMLAPGYYRSVRIYNGRLPDGIANSRGLRLTRAKYFDYCSDPLWQAVREIE
ncbi:MAG: hypothetical protein ACE5E7_13390 [Anaerolineae bacterium]